MDIRFSKSGQPTFVALGPSADGSAEAYGPTNLRVNGGPVLETVGFLRAAAVKVFNRGNLTFNMSFTVWREHTDTQTAEDYVLSHPGELPTAAEMVCAITLNSGAIRYLTTPFIEITDSNCKGKRTEHSYRITGGQLQAANPYA